MEVVQSTDRPDVGGTPPKMQAICELARKELDAPYLEIWTNDNIMSSVTIVGSFDPVGEWAYGIFENSRRFILHIVPEKGKRYYTEGENVTGELTSMSRRINKKFRKYTSTPEKVVQKIKGWLKPNQ